MDAQSFEVVRLAARSTAPDFYLSALLAPRPSRDDLIVLAAFAGDVDRIVSTVSEPALAEIRLQWWRDAIMGAAEGKLTGSPLADALIDVIRRRGLPVEALDGILTARADDLYADPLAGEADLVAYLDAAYGALFRLGTRCIAGGDPSSTLHSSAGEAYGRARLLATLARFQARGRSPFPGNVTSPVEILEAELPAAQQALARARAAWHAASTADRTACLSLGMVQPYLAAVQRGGHDPARFIAEISPLTRVWRVWAARRLGRI